MTTDVSSVSDPFDARAQKFQIEVAQSDLDRIWTRVSDYPHFEPPRDEGDDWKYGMNSRWLESFCSYWVDGYDWRRAESDLNRYPQYRTTIDGVDVHFVEILGEAGGRRPLLLLHGWPGSFFEFWEVAEQLAFPSKFGGSPEDAFDLVIPSLPGYAFSGAIPAPVGPRTIGRLMDRLMVDGLGYENYMVHGGDQGAIAASWMGHDSPGTCRALHANLVGWRPALDDDGGVEPGESEYLQQRMMGELPDMAYAIQHWTKPQTLAIALMDSPVGTATWMLDKFHDWAHLDGRSFDEVYGRDRLLTSVMIYLVTGSIATSLWSYPALLDERAVLADRPYCPTPTGIAVLPHEVVGFTPPRSWVDRYYNVVQWSETDHGGHFAAVERADWLIEDIRLFAREHYPAR